ncbi:MAG: FG-GAP-like repeat-containing protein, partial [Planctomycetaceae bacterium]
FFAIERLAFLLGLYGRGWESIPYRLRLIQFQRHNAAHLDALAMGYATVENPEALIDDFKVSPDDPLVVLGMSRMAYWQQDFKRSLQLAEKAARLRPDLVEAHVRIGQALWEEKDDRRFLKWNAGLPKEAENHPEVWALRGMWALDGRQTDAAARCFWEAIRRDPNHRQAVYQLAQLLQKQSRPRETETLLSRAHALTEYVNTVTAARSGENANDAVLAAQQAKSLGLLWESYAWFEMTLVLQNDHHLAQQGVQSLGPRLENLELTRTAASYSPAESIDLSDFPLPQWDAATPRNKQKSDAPYDGEPALITFADRAEESGMQFKRIDFRTTPGRARTIRETTGGGVAAFDYDGDGWPDVYLTQSSPWPPRDSDTADVDQLFRNRGDGRFERVTEPSAIVEQRYSQGVTIGDYNDDGFPDLFVANIGKNRLYENNGDGTFSDVSEMLDDPHEEWSTSCVLADFNNDRWPDLYVVNYLTGDDVYGRICSDKESLSGVCGPQLFTGAQDRFFLNQGNGTFVEMTRLAGVTAEGKGLGVVAADLTGRRQLSLFVANDTVPNLFFVNATESPGGRPAFSEEGLAAGVALDGDGLALACMGVAVGDADENGLIDLFVTNFYQESNTLYLQQADGLFVDGTREAGLRSSSLPMLGFGAQFIDADLDGRRDLMVTNGHVHDGTNRGIAYRMPPQFYRNVGRGRFVEFKAEQLGPFFDGRYLGRGMARLDWNRDGKEDVAISHIEAPAALVTNTSPTTNRFFSLQLRGVDSSRDAIGTTVTVKAGEQTQHQQLTAGDGYQASNERQLTFGLGAHSQIDECTIRWPSGLEQRFVDIAADQFWLAVEGNSELVAMPR